MFSSGFLFGSLRIKFGKFKFKIFQLNQILFVD